MRKQTKTPPRTVSKKPRPKQDRAAFERAVAELKASLEKLPADRQEALMRVLEEEKP